MTLKGNLNFLHTVNKKSSRYDNLPRPFKVNFVFTFYDRVVYKIGSKIILPGNSMSFCKNDFKPRK